MTLFCFTLPVSLISGTSICQLSPYRLPRVLMVPSSFDGQSGTSFAVLMPFRFSSPRQLIAFCQSSSAVSSVLPSSAATVSLSRLICCSLPFASRVISAGGRPSPFTEVRNDSV
ncbi:hypothetical protein D3C87_1812830 [compost metagenome]